MRVGVTGHQELGPEAAVEWLRRAVSDAVKQYDVTEGYTCLAAGADQLYAEILKRENIPFVAVIPSKKYDDTFKRELDYENYLMLSSYARKLVKLKFDEPSEEAFFEAGKEVVNLSEAVFAIWDGKVARGLGGTADVVQYALQMDKAVVHFNPVSQDITVK
jgi:hypothetical protein